MASEPVSCRKVIVEAGAVVASILLAFGIDAGWDARREGGAEGAAIEALRLEMQANRHKLAETIRYNDEARASVVAYLRLSPQQITSMPNDSFPSSAMHVELWAPFTFDPELGGTTAFITRGESTSEAVRAHRRAVVNWDRTFVDAGEEGAVLKGATGATVFATKASAAVLRRGIPGEDDPQHESALPFPSVKEVAVVAPGDTVRVGALKVVAHLTPGHSPGGTTWTWSSCERARCMAFVYADSQTPVSDDGFRFSDGGRAPEFERGLATIAGLPCEVLVTPHPGASGLWERIGAREAGDLDALVANDACGGYAARGREQLARRLARERGQG